MDWVWLQTLTSEPTRIVRVGHDGENPSRSYVIEILRRSHAGAPMWDSDITILTAAEYHLLRS